MLNPSLGELVGGEDRIDRTLFESCGDSLIVNLGSDEWVDVSCDTISADAQSLIFTSQ